MKRAITLALSLALGAMAFAPLVRGGWANALAGGAAQPQASWVEPTKAEPAGTKYRTFPSKTIKGEVSYLFGGSKDYFQANSPWTLLEKNADAIRGRTHVRMWIGDQDTLLDWNKQYHELLERLNVAHEFEVVEGVGHNYRQLYEKMGERGFAFYVKAFAAASRP